MSLRFSQCVGIATLAVIGASATIARSADAQQQHEDKIARVDRDEIAGREAISRASNRTPAEIRISGNALARTNDSLARELAFENEKSLKAGRSANNITTLVAGLTAVFSGTLKEATAKWVGVGGGAVGAFASYYTGQKQPNDKNLKCVVDYNAAKGRWLIDAQEDSTTLVGFQNFTRALMGISANCPIFQIVVPDDRPGGPTENDAAELPAFTSLTGGYAGVYVF